MSLSTLSAPELPRTDKGLRICQVVKVRPERLDEYKKVHAAVWPEVLGALRKAHVVDYSINYFAPLNLLIAHMRYIGPPENYKKDMEGIKESEMTRKWWALTDGMQESFVEGATGSESGPGWWANPEEVFRFEGRDTDTSHIIRTELAERIGHMPHSSSRRRSVDREDGEVEEGELPILSSSRPARPVGAKPQWSNPLDNPGPSRLPPRPQTKPLDPFAPSSFTTRLPISRSPENRSVERASIIISPLKESLPLPARPGKSPRKTDREWEKRSGREKERDYESRIEEDRRPRNRYGDEYSPPPRPRRLSPDPYDRRRSPPRYDERYRDDQYHREREERYGRADIPQRDERRRQVNDPHYSSAWGEYKTHRDPTIREYDRSAGARGGDRYRDPSRSPRRRRLSRNGHDGYDERDRRPPKEAELETGEIQPSSDTAAPALNGISRPPTPDFVPPASPDPPNTGAPRAPPIRILNRPTRRLPKDDPPSPPSAAPPEPPSEAPPDIPLSPAPPPPDSTPPPAAPPTASEPPEPPHKPASPPPTKVVDVIPNGDGQKTTLPKSVPHAPNRNLLDPPTRATTPTGKLHVNPYEPAAKRFRTLSAEEELARLGKTFVGTTGLAAYDLGAKLGEGTFGVVTKGIEIATKRAIALKKIITHNPRDGVSVTTVREIKILKSLNHPNVVPIIDMVVHRKLPGDRGNRGEVFMVFPYMDHDLCGLLANKDFKLSHSLAKMLMRQILEGMAYIHANNFVHRDIKTANILVDKHGQIMIADFGLARTWTHDAAMPRHLANEYTNMVVTRWYRAPELLLGDTRYGPAVDMWSLGCVLGEMYHKNPILAGDSDRDQLYQIFAKCGPLSQKTFPDWDKLPGFPDAQGHPWDKAPMEMPILECAKHWNMDQAGADLMSSMLTLDPKKRITAHDALDHPWFWIAPLPADPTKTALNVESSHEMTTRQKHEPAQAPMVAAQVRPPPQQMHRGLGQNANRGGEWGLPAPGHAHGQGQAFANVRGPHYDNYQGPPPGYGPPAQQAGLMHLQGQNGNAYGFPGQGQMAPTGPSNHNPYQARPHAPPNMTMGVGMGMSNGLGNGMGMGMGNGMGNGMGMGMGMGGGMGGNGRPSNVPAAPFKLSSGPSNGIPTAPFKLAGGGPGSLPTRPPSGPSAMGMGYQGAKRGPPGDGDRWREDKRRRGDPGLPY